VHPEGIAEGERPPQPDFETQTACFRAWKDVFGGVDSLVWQARSEGANDQHDISLNPEAESIYLS
jgi:hypothetical protein